MPTPISPSPCPSPPAAAGAPPGTWSAPGRRPFLLVPLLLVLALLLGACSAAGGGDEGQADAPAAPQAVSDSAGDGAAEADGAEGGGEVAAGAGSVDVAAAGAPMMVRSVRLDLLVEDVPAAVAKARATATASGGWVSSEEVSPGTDTRSGWGTLVLRVPAEALDTVVADLGELGEVRSSRSQADDVTVEYRDVEARVKTLEASADRLRELVGEATGVESIATLERELADREVELDALKARMKVLGEDVARSTITLHLAEESSALDDAGDRTGFVAGLQRGWDAFLSSVTVVLTALGALLPFVAVLALVGVPLLLWLRRRRAQTLRSGAGAPLASTGDRQEDAAGDPDRA